MSDPGRKCATCVFWLPRDGSDCQSPGRCRARLLDALDSRMGFMTQADFVCPQWCGRTSTTEAAE